MYVSGKAARIKALSRRGLLLGTILLTVQVLSSRPNQTLDDASGNLLLAKSYISQGCLGDARRLIQSAGQQAGADAYLNSLRYSLLFSLDSMEGNYQLALQDRIRFRAAHDAYTSKDQLKQLDALKLKFATEKKDEDIRLLRQRELAQQAGIKQSKSIGNILLVGVLLLLIMIGVVTAGNILMNTYS
ncbi:hypothetical protein Q4E93_11195 [Flavitalea sp. BT771]|uniref:hypothetical protein n=1 Tax=Flavitalea sp. BT771 TaxID=3063329 RepID=UPI0026E3DC7E|nr:hypothetical protein [Flavitalea sp. BT771]MDO6431158.1 hypothetical protein [Flavitalea sp. BT771]MDV6220065.1 hypothetical protein [Flavitalea sp. BT771]